MENDMVIYKYPLNPVTVLNLPPVSDVLCVQMQRDKPYLWVKQAPTKPKQETVPRTFVMIGTGHPIGEAGTNDLYLGTFQMQGGALVFHVFERM